MLICPNCAGPLAPALTCPGCGWQGRYRDGLPVLLPQTYVAVAPEGVSAEAIVVFIGPQQGD